MTYAKGSVALAADYNALAGLTGTAAASPAAATAIAGYLWGVGYGDRGYGQTAPNLTALTAGTVDPGSAWSNLQTTMSNLATWQNTTATLLPPNAAMSQGAVGVAYPSGSSPYDIQTLLTNLDTNRLNYQVGNMTLTASVATNTRATVWGTSGGGITGTFTVTFASADAARYFFNTGGQLRLVLAHPNTTTTRDTDWHSFLSNIGTVNFAADGTTLTGNTGNTGNAVGFYQLTGTAQNIVAITSFASPYTTNTATITAQVSGTASNGGPGNVVTFTITLNDTYYTAFDNVGVALGTNVVLSHLRAGAVLSTLPAAPTCVVGTNF